MYVKKDYACNPATCNCDNGKYLRSNIDDSAITCDEIWESCIEDLKAKLHNKKKF